MFSTDRDAESFFVFLASPVAGGSYGLMIYPEIPEIKAQVEVSKRRLKFFLARHRQEIAVEEISGTEDLFVSLLTRDELRELTDGEVGVRRCGVRLISRQ